MSVIYPTSLNGVLKIKPKSNCYDQEFDSVQACSTFYFGVVSNIDFLHVIRKHKPQILNSFDAEDIVKITDEHKELAAAVARERSLKAALEKDAKKSFNQAWEPADLSFFSLSRFAAGLASVMPEMSRVEADFYFINF